MDAQLRYANRTMIPPHQHTGMARERDDSGQYVETVSLDAVLDVFEQVAGPIITSGDVADALDCTTEAARQKLLQLNEDGELGKRKAGRTLVYWRLDDE